MPSSSSTPNFSARPRSAFATRPGTSENTRSAIASLVRRKRCARARNRCTDTPGRSSSSGRSPSWSSEASELSVTAVAVAVRGPGSKSESSPNISPGPSTARRFSRPSTAAREIFTFPSRTMNRRSPVSPSLNTRCPRTTSRVVSAPARSSAVSSSSPTNSGTVARTPSMSPPRSLPWSLPHVGSAAGSQASAEQSRAQSTAPPVAVERGRQALAYEGFDLVGASAVQEVDEVLADRLVAQRSLDTLHCDHQTEEHAGKSQCQQQDHYPTILPDGVRGYTRALAVDRPRDALGGQRGQAESRLFAVSGDELTSCSGEPLVQRRAVRRELRLGPRQVALQLAVVGVVRGDRLAGPQLGQVRERRHVVGGVHLLQRSPAVVHALVAEHAAQVLPGRQVTDLRRADEVQPCLDDAPPVGDAPFLCRQRSSVR